MFTFQFLRDKIFEGTRGEKQQIFHRSIVILEMGSPNYSVKYFKPRAR